MHLNDNEIMIRKSRGTHRRGVEGVGGRLFLTNHRLVFKPHFFNIQTHEEGIALGDIVVVEAKYSDFISAKMSIHLRNGSVHKFLVPQRKTWVENIEKAIQELRK